MPTSETTTAPDPSQSTQTGNLFDVLAHLLMTTRLSLENPRAGGELPRYVRIARINSDDTTPQGDVSFLETITEVGTGGLVITISKMIDLALRARELFGETDSVKALVEVVLQLFKEGSKLTFTDEARNLFNLPTARIFPADVENTLIQIEKYIDFIPAPEDLDRIGHELYRMACVVYKKDKSVDVDLTGKVRLLQWNFGLEWNVDDYPGKLKHIGKRNMEPDPFFSAELFYDKVKILNVYTGVDDATEVKDRLLNLGYTPGTSALNYKEFQFANGLAVTGKLDVHTINRLLNLDFVGKNIRRAIRKPSNLTITNTDNGGYLDIVNGDADSFEEEGIVLNTTTGKMPYYQLGKQYNGSPAAAWVVDPGVVLLKPANGLMHGFVGLRSRAYLGNNIFDGDTFSEGEAASGNFFFGARIIAPWMPGRSGPPPVLQTEPKMLYGADATVYTGFVSRMYQDINIDLTDSGFFTKIPLNYSLVLYASCMRRSCYNDKAMGTPDQGRILINIIYNENDQRLKDTFTEDWQPSGAITDALLKERGKDIKNVWFLQKSNPIVVSKAGTKFSFSENKKVLTTLEGLSSVKVRVILEGKLMSGWDIDAYFDDVRVRWDYVKTT